MSTMINEDSRITEKRSWNTCVYDGRSNVNINVTTRLLLSEEDKKKLNDSLVTILNVLKLK